MIIVLFSLGRNEAVEKVIIHDKLDLTPPVYDHEPGCVPGNEWSEQQTHDYRMGFSNLRSLNDSFELQILLQWTPYNKFEVN